MFGISAHVVLPDAFAALRLSIKAQCEHPTAVFPFIPFCPIPRMVSQDWDPLPCSFLLLGDTIAFLCARSIYWDYRLFSGIGPFPSTVNSPSTALDTCPLFAKYFFYFGCIFDFFIFSISPYSASFPYGPPPHLLSQIFLIMSPLLCA